MASHQNCTTNDLQCVDVTLTLNTLQLRDNMVFFEYSRFNLDQIV